MSDIPNLREIAPAVDGSRHIAAWHIAREVGVASMHIIVDGTQRLLGTVAVETPDGPDTPVGPDAHLVVSEALSPYSGGLVYTPVSMYISHNNAPDTYYQVILD